MVLGLDRVASLKMCYFLLYRLGLEAIFFLHRVVASVPLDTNLALCTTFEFIDKGDNP